MKNVVLLAALPLALNGGEDPGYTAHEWGTFTSVSGDDGWALDWRPLSGPSDLPDFVYDVRKKREPDLGKGVWTTVRMETPVIYFYSDREREVNAKVLFPKGRITEWYPAAKAVPGGYDWGKVKILPRSNAKPPKDGKPSHYYPAREVDAATIQIGQEVEKFIFYRGVGNFGLPLKARRHTDNEVVLTAAGEPLENVILFENRGGQVGFTVVERLAEKAKLERPVLNQTLSGIRSELERALLKHGLYPKEAAAMLETWKDTWFEEGLRAFYIVPRRTTDELLPLKLQPAPKACVRVLVGRAEILTPAFEARVEALVDRINGGELGRAPALAELRKLGRFAHPVLTRLAPSIKPKDAREQVYRLIYN